jgi:putative nucleotidyltransferase with HDIG domain
MQELDDYIKRVKHLPPAPAILPKLLAVLSQPDTDSSQVVDLITYDPSLTANVLQLCNSAFFAAGTPVADIQEAVGRLGFNQVYRLVVAISGARTLTPPQKGYGFEKGDLWKHSVAAAVAAQCIAEDQGDDANVIFTAGLLHDIGKIILADALEHIYAKLVQETESQQHALLETEKKLLGVQHAEIGGRLLALWKFPSNLVSAVWFHHQPDGAAPYERLAAFVYLGNMIAHFLGFGFGHQAFAFRGRSEALQFLGMTPDQLPRYMILTYERFETVESLFRLSP